MGYNIGENRDTVVTKEATRGETILWMLTTTASEVFEEEGRIRRRNTEELYRDRNLDQYQNQAPDYIPKDIPQILLPNPHPCHLTFVQ